MRCGFCGGCEEVACRYVARLLEAVAAKYEAAAKSKAEREKRKRSRPSGDAVAAAAAEALGPLVALATREDLAEKRDDDDREEVDVSLRGTGDLVPTVSKSRPASRLGRDDQLTGRFPRRSRTTTSTGR